MKQLLLFVFAVPLISLLINILTLSHYGINWDEPYHYRRGQAFLQFYLTGKKTYDGMPKYPPLKGDSDNPNFRNGEANFKAVQINPSLSDLNFRRSFYQDDSWNGDYFIDVENSYGHPPLNDIFAAFFNKVFYQILGVMGDLESYRFFIVFTVFAASLVIAVFMWKEFGIFESVISTLIFATYPLLLGEQHFNIKDPFEASFYIITLIFGYLGLKNKKMFFVFLSIISFSVALSTKFNIVFSLIPLAVWFIYYYLIAKKDRIDKRLIRIILIACVLGPIISIGLLILSFPTVWKNPINGLMQIVKFYLEVGYPTSLPKGYYFFGFINTLPLSWIIYTSFPIVILLFIMSAFLWRRLVKKSSFILLLFVSFLITVGRNSLFNALSYGGVRLIMEFIPVVAILSGAVTGILVKTGKHYGLIVFCIILILFIPSIFKLVRIHPNENEYFSFLVGGLKGAKDINLPSWGNSNGNAYFPGISWLNENAPLNAKVSIPVGNTSNIPRFKLRPDISVSPYYWSGLKHEGEYLIELTYDYAPMNWFALSYLNNAMVPVYEVKVDGVAVSKVWKNDIDHVKKEFLNLGEMNTELIADKTNKTLSVEIPENKKVMKIQIVQPTKDCNSLKTGFVTSSDGTNSIREVEDIAVDQTNREELKPLGPIYEFMFFERYAKTFIFNVDDSTSCLLKAKSAKVIFLNS